MPFTNCYFTNQFIQVGAPVPEIFAVNSDNTIYIQEDFGDFSLLNAVEANGQNEMVLIAGGLG